MISQRCPKCSSSRIRRGYAPTPLLLRLICRYNLLCDACNWLFRGFAIPLPIGRASKKRRQRPVLENKTQQTARAPE